VTVFSDLVPVFRIFDVAKALEFYRDFLGMTVVWEHRFEPTLPLYMEVERDGLVLHLSEHYGDSLPGSTIRVKVQGLTDFHAELTGKQYGYLRPASNVMRTISSSSCSTRSETSCGSMSPSRTRR
jgi:ribosomal-protein-alanine N-acetyltransferase